MRQIPMTGTRGRALRVGTLSPTWASRTGDVDTRRQPVLGEGLLSAWVRYPSAAAAMLLLLAGCVTDNPPPVTAAPRTPAVCEALRPSLPIRYSSKGDTAETVKQVKEANARFSAACP